MVSLPVYAAEERLIAKYSLDHFDSALSESSRMPFQSSRSRYYSADCLVAFGRLDDAKANLREARATDLKLSVSYVIGQERHEDNAVIENLPERLFRADFPRAD